jgi:two-component system sensor kinase FixL
VRTDPAARAAAFALAFAVGCALTLIRLLLQEQLGGTSPFLFSWPGIMLAAFIGGFWPALAVTGVGLWVGQHVLAEAGARTIRPVGIFIYLAFGLVFAIAGGLRRQALRRAAENAARLAELQARMVQMSRLNALGEMAGSLAHELNQPLTAITNYVSAAQQLLGRDPARAGELLGKIAAQAQRAGQIVSRARASVDRGELAPAAESLPELVHEAVDIATTGAPHADAAIRYTFDPGAERVLADRIQVQQVILNLVRNALEAMAGCSRRELRIGSRSEGEFVEVHVADTGPGIAPELAESLFQPFVSGKPNGMGVGLAICRSIIESHGGKIWAAANPEGGAVFHFSLPRAGERAAA